MVALNVVQRLRHTNDLRAYRRKLSAEIHQSILPRLLPAILDVPLPIVGADGAPRHLDDTLEQASYLLLAGTTGSGRTIALQHIAQRWLASDDTPIPALIFLPRIDDGRTAPLTLLGDVLALATQPNSRVPRKPGPPAPTLPERMAGWALLVSGLEELPVHRQLAWRAVLQVAPQQWPETHVVVAVPREEARWPGFTTLTIAQPAEEVVERWVDMLAPIERRAAITAALRAGERLAPLGDRLFEVALLAIVAPRAGLPGSRAALYDSALDIMFELDRRREATQAAVEALQLLAAYDERPKTLIAGLIEPAGTGALRFNPPLFRTFLAARQLATEGRYELLAALDMPERRELARFCATIAGDIGPLYLALWGNGKPNAEELLTMGMCLRERPDSPPTWTLRVVGALALLARDGRAGQRGHAGALLRQCRAALDATFAALHRADASVQRVIPQILNLLPAELSLSYAEHMAYDPQIAEPLAWDLADLLVNRPAQNTAFPAPPSAAAARARWTYVQALRSAEHRAALGRTVEAEAILGLAQTNLDDSRLLRVAAVLIDDHQLSTDLRVAGVALLANNSQPTALTVIERACYDPDAVVRQAALGALAGRDASRGQTALSRAAIDQEAPGDTRIGAIERLATRFAEESQPLLARCARDTSLPLYAQLMSVAALGEAALGPLSDIVRDEESHPEVRALAATRLGTIEDSTYAPLLRALLEHPETSSDLLQGICAGIAALGESALEPLLRLLLRSAADIELTEAVVHALGQLKLEGATTVLGDLVGAGALDRLHSVVPHGLREQATHVALESQELPAPLALELQKVIARAATEADIPTTMREFLREQADGIRRTAAAALAAIGGNTARAALMAALIDDTCGNASDSVVGALAQTGPSSAEALGHLLSSPEINPMIRWMAVQHLRDHPQGEPVMHRALSQTTIDSFTRGALGEALGQRGAITALPLLRHLADDPSGDPHLRSQAVVGLGLLNEPATEVVLIRMLSDHNEEPTLRGLAAEHLPTHLSAEGRRLLRELLRRERQPEPLTAGILSMLGRVHDREALPLLLRFSQDERADVARAALGALAELGDGSVAPVLVRVAQNPAAERATRLRAIGTLLKIGGDGYRPLLRTYLEDGPLPLRLQALDHLIESSATTRDLLDLLANSKLPLPIRLRILNILNDKKEACQGLIALIADPAEDLELRVRAVGALRYHCHALAAPTLIALAADAPDAIRVACIEALSSIGGTNACTALSNLAEGSSQSPAIRAYARRALRTAIEHAMSTNQPSSPTAGAERASDTAYASAALPSHV